VIAARLPLLADLFEVVEAETPYGGRSVSYEPVGSAWLRLGTPRRRERTEAGRGSTVETLTAESRIDSRLTVGRVLRFGGGHWRIVSGEADSARVILNLERTR
jgi:hypothetical protein